MAVSIVRVLVVVVSSLLIAYVAFELLRPDVLLVGNVTIDVLQGGTRVGASPSSSRPGGVNDLFAASVLVHNSVTDTLTNSGRSRMDLTMCRFCRLCCSCIFRTEEAVLPGDSRQ